MLQSYIQKILAKSDRSRFYCEGLDTRISMAGQISFFSSHAFPVFGGPNLFAKKGRYPIFSVTAAIAWPPRRPSQLRSVGFNIIFREVMAMSDYE